MASVTETEPRVGLELQVLERAPGFLWVTHYDPAALRQRETVWINEAFYAFTGADRERDVSEVLSECVHPDDIEEVWLQWERARDARASYEKFVRYRRYDGEYHWYWVRVNYGADGYWYGAALDVQHPMLMKGLAATMGGPALAAIARELRSAQWRSYAIILMGVAMMVGDVVRGVFLALR